MLNWNLAEEYAERFHIPSQTTIEADWQFRERVARYLQEIEKPLLAHEVLFNRYLSGDPFARLELNSGYDDAFISQVAQKTEAAFRYEMEQQEQRQTQRQLLTIFCFWKKSRAG